MRLFTSRNQDAWGFGLVVIQEERCALLMFGPFALGVTW